MIEITEAIVLALIELLIFYVLGFNLPMNAKDGKTSIAENICSGFLIYTAVFEVAAVYATWLELPLTTFFYIWAVILSGMIVFTFVFHIRNWGHRIRFFFGHLKIRPLLLLSFAAFAFLCVTAVIGAGGDGLHTSAGMSTDLYYDSLGSYDAVSGAKLTRITPVELLLRWRVSGEFFGTLTDLNPAMVTGLTGTIVTVALFSMILYRIGRHLFRDSTNIASLFLAACAVVLFFFAAPESKYGGFFRSAYSGRSMFAFVLVPAMILISIMVAQNENWHHLFLLAFCAGISGPCLSDASWYLMPVLIPACLIPACIVGKRWKGIFFMIICEILPAAAALFCWLVSSVPITS